MSRAAAYIIIDRATTGKRRQRVAKVTVHARQADRIGQPGRWLGAAEAASCFTRHYTVRGEDAFRTKSEAERTLALRVFTGEPWSSD